MNGAGGDTWRAATRRLDQLDSRRVGLAALIIAMGASAALILWLERGALFASDEWAWIYFSGLGSFVDILRPINQHVAVTSMLMIKACIALWGLSMLPFKLVEISGAIACSGLLYVYSRRRIGPMLALAPAMVPLFLGTATSIVLQPLIGLQLIYSVAFGLGALVAVEQESRRWDVVACVLGCLAVTTFSTGLAFLAGVAVAVLLSSERLRRAYVFLVPVALFVGIRIWALQYGTAGSPMLENVPILPFYFVDSIAAAATSLFGREAIVGHGPGTSLFLDGFSLEQATATLVFAAFEVTLIVFAAQRLHRRGTISPSFWSALAVLVALWTLQGLVLVAGRAPGENRYLYSGAVVLMLVAVEFARGVRLSRLAVAAVLVLTVAGIAGNMPRFKEGRDGIVLNAPRGRAYTAVMELAGANADPIFNPVVDTPDAAPAGVLNFSVGGYFELRERYGSLAIPLSEVMQQSEDIRHGSDEVMVGMLRLQLTDATALPRRGCFRATPEESGELVVLPPGGAVLQASADTPVALRRFADREVVPIGDLEAGRPAELAIPADRARPWELWAREPATLTVCPLPDGGESSSS